MSESVAKPRTMIDLDEFERRLRRPSAASPAAGGDALAELARLVGDQKDPFAAVFAQHEQAQMRREPVVPHYDEEWDVPAPAVPPPQPAPRSRPLAGDFAAIEAGLRGSLPPEPMHFPAAGMRPPPYHDDHAAHLAVAGHGAEADWDLPPPLPHFAAVAETARPRSRRPLYVTAAIILVGLGGIGVSFALKGRAHGPHEIALIKAADGPTKVQAANNTTDQPDQNASLLDKGPQPAPTAIVNRTEQPVDLGRPDAAPGDRPMRVVTLGSTQVASNAASVPVPPPPGQTDTNPILPPFGTMDMIEPRKVKTISVRADGTPLPADASVSTADTPASRAPENIAAPKAATPKPGSRGVTTSKTPAAQESGRTATQGDPAKAHEAVRSPHAQATRPVKVAMAEADTKSDSRAARGDFAVQLAAPATEEEARHSATRLGRRFGSVLAGHHLTFHHATVGEKSVYRVRVGGLSHEEAITLCEKLKATGGSCFVARD